MLDELIYGIEVVEAKSVATALPVNSPPLPPASPCPACLSPIFYLTPYSTLLCLNCHPPISAAMVRRKLIVVEIPAETSSPGGAVRFAWEEVDGESRPGNGNGPIANGVTASPQAHGEAGAESGYCWPCENQRFDAWWASLPDNPPQATGWSRATRAEIYNRPGRITPPPPNSICVSLELPETWWAAARIGARYQEQLPLPRKPAARPLACDPFGVDDAIDPFGLDDDERPLAASVEVVAGGGRKSEVAEVEKIGFIVSPQASEPMRAAAIVATSPQSFAVEPPPDEKFILCDSPKKRRSVRKK